MTPQEQIFECEEQLLEAIKASNIDALEALLHDNLIFNIPTGQTITKSIDIENYKSGIMTVSEMVATDQIIKIVDEIATVAVTIHLKAKYANQMIDGKFRYLRVWKRFDNSWKVIAGSGFLI
jgi:ketosteroid isomerase-like protein